MFIVCTGTKLARPSACRYRPFQLERGTHTFQLVCKVGKNCCIQSGQRFCPKRRQRPPTHRLPLLLDVFNPFTLQERHGREEGYRGSSVSDPFER